MAHTKELVLAAGAVAAMTCLAQGQVFIRDIFYTKYQTTLPTDKNVKKATVTYNSLGPSVSIGPRVDIARTGGADGIIFAPDSDLLVGGQFTGNVFKINRTTNAFVTQPSGQGQAFHETLDPGGLKFWTAGLPGNLAEVPLNPFGPGTSHAVTGDDTAVVNIEWVGNRTFYTSSNGGGHGNFGEINMATFVTHRFFTNVNAAHGLRFDPYTGHLLMFGEDDIIQVNPNTNPPSIVSTLHLSSRGFADMDIDQGAPDGQGLVFAASNDTLGGRNGLNARLVLVDYRASHLIGDAGNFVAAPALDDYLDDIAPLINVPNVCCEIGNGEFDNRDGSLSQLPGQSTVPFDYRTADDFYLCGERMYRIRSIEGTMLTDSVLPKAILELYADCDGAPVDPPFLTTQLSDASITDTGATFQGKRVLKVRWDFTDLWLRGGKSYWVSLIGRGLGSPNEVWFWGTAGNGTIRGRPGAFKSVSSGIPNWRSLESPCATCIGCTDFAFCVTADSCKILNDNGTWAPSGTVSLDGPGGITFARTADDFVVPPCHPAPLCYIEAYIATNCAQARVSIYQNGCFTRTPTRAGGDYPNGFSPIATLTPNRIVNTGQVVVINGVTLPVLCLQFWDIGLTLPPGQQYWLSAFGLGTGNVGQLAYFLYNRDCTRSCLIKWNEGVIYGPAVGQTDWVHGSVVTGTPHDYSFLVAITDQTVGPALPGGGNGCTADINLDGHVTVQDVFEFLHSWFIGCP